MNFLTRNAQFLNLVYQDSRWKKNRGTLKHGRKLTDESR